MSESETPKSRWRLKKSRFISQTNMLSFARLDEYSQDLHTGDVAALIAVVVVLVVLALGAGENREGHDAEDEEISPHTVEVVG